MMKRIRSSTHNPFQRGPHRSGLSGAEYHFDTLILRHAKLMEADPLAIVAENTASIAHENVHWLQQNGTTIGAFLTFLRYTQYETLRLWISRLPKATKDRLRKIFEQGQPLLGYDSNNFSLIPPDATLGDTFATLSQMWYDCQLVYLIFHKSSQQDNFALPHQRGNVMGDIVADTILYACEHYKLGIYPEHSIARSWYNFPQVFFASYAKQRLTTFSLFESMATANEFLIRIHWYCAHNVGEKSLQEANQRLQEGKYGLAFNAFQNLLSLDIKKDPIAFFSTFSIVCDLALNPPLPPIVLFPPVETKNWEWKHIYPPLRFMQLIDAVNQVGLLEGKITHTNIKNYQDKLCDYLGWINPSNYTILLKSGNFRDFSTYEPETSVFDLTMSYQEYLLWVQSKMWELRGQSLPIFTNYASAICGELVPEYAELLLPGGSGERWISPQLYWTVNNKLGYARSSKHEDAKSKAFGNWLLFSAAITYYTYDMVYKGGELDFRPYPPDVAQSEQFKNIIRQSLLNVFQ